MLAIRPVIFHKMKTTRSSSKVQGKCQKGPINLGRDGSSSPEASLLPVCSTDSSEATIPSQHHYDRADTDNSYSSRKQGGLIYSWQNLVVTADIPLKKDDATGIKNDDIEIGCCGRKQTAAKPILKNVSGIARPNELLAIMGASGAGKTTLLNALTFRNTKGLIIGGQRCVNGQPMTRDMLSSLSAYVQQRDIFVGTLTVREHLVFHARVRMSPKRSMAYRLKRVEEAIVEFGLSKCADSMIGIPGRMKGISCGEMKRLSFASEVLTDPPLMFCDEPTSGLDSFMAQNIVQALQNLAQQGKTIICTIHQPSSEVYAMFDRILLMAEGGIAYFGDASNALQFFKSTGHECPINYNPADFFVQTLAVQPGNAEKCRQKVLAISNQYSDSVHAANVKNEIDNSSYMRPKIEKLINLKGPYKASWSSQFSAVLWRSWITLMKDPWLFKVRLAVTTFTALLFGLVYLQQDLDQEGVMNMSGIMFLMVANMTFQNAFAVMSVFSTELPIFLREHFNGMYRTDVYFLCKTIAEVPIFFIVPFVFATITYWMVGFSDDVDRYIVAATIIVLVANVAASFGYLLSCWAPNVSTTLDLGSIFIIPLSLFGGFFMNDKTTPVYFIWLKYLSWYRYGNEALSINQWRDVDGIECGKKYSGNTTCITNGEMILNNYGFSENDLGFDLAMLVALIILFRILAFLGLLRKTYAHS